MNITLTDLIVWVVVGMIAGTLAGVVVKQKKRRIWTLWEFGNRLGWCADRGIPFQPTQN